MQYKILLLVNMYILAAEHIGDIRKKKCWK